MKRIFISQPMNGKTEQEILLNRMAATTVIYRLHPLTRIYFLDSFITGAKDVNPLFCLGHSLQALSKADEAWFIDGWQESRGCRIEHACCVEYNIPIHYLDKNGKEVKDDVGH